MSSRWTRRAILRTGSAALAPLLQAQQPRPVRVGIIGLEGHFSEVTEAAKVRSEIQIVAVAAGKPREIQRFSGNRALAGAKRYDDYRRMLDAEKLDVVAICDENGQRAASVIACAEHGLAIAAEKPLAISLEEADAVKKSIARRNVRLTMLLPMRFEPHYAAMRTILQSGEIGEPVALGAQKSYKLGMERGQRPDRKSTRLNSSHSRASRMPSSA